MGRPQRRCPPHGSAGARSTYSSACHPLSPCLRQGGVDRYRAFLLHNSGCAGSRAGHPEHRTMIKKLLIPAFAARSRFTPRRTGRSIGSGLRTGRSKGPDAQHADADRHSVDAAHAVARRHHVGQPIPTNRNRAAFPPAGSGNSIGAVQSGAGWPVAVSGFPDHATGGLRRLSPRLGTGGERPAHLAARIRRGRPAAQGFSSEILPRKRHQDLPRNRQVAALRAHPPTWI